MKAFFEQLITGIESSVSIIELNMTHFDGPYHFHPELELTWIQKGSGRRYLGDNVSDYGPDDLVLVGANVPHCWLSGKETIPAKAQAIVIQFQPNFAGETFLELPEVTKIQNLIKKANAGMIFKGNTKEKIKSKMVQCTSADGFSRLLRFFEILDLAANSKEVETIAPYSTAMTASPAETERFQKVFSFLISNYQQEISLKAVAKIANLTPTAFCRYMKNVTRKTLVEIVTEFRINHACQLLRNSKKSVNEICFECGFGNISYFNKTFKAFTKFSPLQYRRLLLGQ
jgi:AraC-like DNA-binding protein/mannose-6-phosphate isomerase-like protein (cupin superfamily)